MALGAQRVRTALGSNLPLRDSFPEPWFLGAAPPGGDGTTKGGGRRPRFTYLALVTNSFVMQQTPEDRRASPCRGRRRPRAPAGPRVVVVMAPLAQHDVSTRTPTQRE